MRVTYTWTEREWREAVALASGRQSRPMLPGFTSALVVLPLIGGAAELIIHIRTQQFTASGTILPLMLTMLTVMAALMAFVSYRSRRRKRQAIQGTMPTGSWEATLQEAGWRFAQADESISPQAPPTHPWTDLAEVRHGDRVIVLMQHDGFHAVPMTSLSPEQSSHLYRLVTRKLRPTASR
jgi:hypothetical protein